MFIHNFCFIYFFLYFVFRSFYHVKFVYFSSALDIIPNIKQSSCVYYIKKYHPHLWYFFERGDKPTRRIILKNEAETSLGITGSIYRQQQKIHLLYSMMMYIFSWCMFINIGWREQKWTREWNETKIWMRK